jgi:hypothetical protein
MCSNCADFKNVFNYIFDFEFLSFENVGITQKSSTEER